MYTTVPMETGFFLATVAAGVITAFLYDLLRISRRIIGPGDSVVGIQDLLFMIAAALILFYAAYRKNSGEMGIHGFLGGGLGIGLYAVIVRNRMLNFGTFVIKWLIKIIEKLLKIVFFPLRLLLKIFKKPVTFIMWYTGDRIRRAKRVAKCNGSRLGIRLKNARLMLRKK